MLTVLYLLAVSHIPHTTHNDELIPVQQLPKFLVHGTSDEIDQVGHVLCTPVSQVDGKKFSNEKNSEC